MIQNLNPINCLYFRRDKLKLKHKIYYTRLFHKILRLFVQNSKHTINVKYAQNGLYLKHREEFRETERSTSLMSLENWNQQVA